MRKVSCSDGWQWCYAIWETECESFPAAIVGMGTMPYRKLNAKVSCRDGRHGCHGGWETICEKFPGTMDGSGAMSDGKLNAKGFLS